MSHGAVSRWLSGSEPRPSRLLLLAETLGVDVSFFESNPSADYQAAKEQKLGGARQFNAVLEPVMRAGVLAALEALDQRLTAVAANDGEFSASNLKGSHEIIDDFAKWAAKERVKLRAAREQANQQPNEPTEIR